MDVFFVIAGFLVTGSLLRGVKRTGQVQVGAFLGRLMIRLLPNALFVLLVVGIASTLIFPVTRQQAVMQEIIASALYFENWQLISNSVDYLARDAGDSPVQHFWAMSIQGQFYLIWLALALLALLVGARRAIGRRLVVLIALVTLMSFGCSVVMTWQDQPVAYFHTATRAWEFGIGGLVAAGLIAAPRLGVGGQRIAGWLGLLLIVGTGLVVPVSSAFPGFAALLPVIGAVLILLSGTPSRGSAASLLSRQPLVWLGGRAYAIYLWHWPLLVFYLHLRGVDQAGVLGGLLVSITLQGILAGLGLWFLGIPFAALRAVCDPADRGLPPLVHHALTASGGVSISGVIGSLLRNPGQIGDLVRLGRESRLAFAALDSIAPGFRAAVMV